MGITVMSLHLLFDKFFVHYGTYYDKKMYFQSVWETYQKWNLEKLWTLVIFY